MKKKTHSFDVFDTCLARLCGEPRNLFDILAAKVSKLLNEENNEYLRQLFVTLRIDAGRGNETLTSIYTEHSQRFPIKVDIKTLVQLEIETEREMLVPIVSTRKIIEELRPTGNILFISDMYLPSGFIQGLLQKYGFFHEGDKLYVSNEYNAVKYDGTLYKKIQQLEHLSYRNWYHYGDNRMSDYTVPKRLGIHSHIINHPYLPYEKQWLEQYSYQYPDTSIIAGISRAIRLRNEIPEPQKNFVCDISAPLMISWVASVMEDACRHGIKRLFFCARDMHSYFIAAREMKEIFPELEIHYLFVSTQALYHDTPLTLEYFKQVGLADNNVPTAFVDTHTKGWCLITINKILSDAGFNIAKGYNLVGSIKNENIEKINTNSSFLIYYPYQKNTGQQNNAKISGMRVLYELVFCLNYHLKTSGYEKHGNIVRPVFTKDDDFSLKNKNIREVKKSNDDLITQYTRAYVAAGLIPYSQQLIRLVTLPTFVDFVSYPHRQYLSYLHEFHYDSRPFVGKIYGKEHPVWKRGSIVYSLPRCIANKCVAIIRKPSVREFLIKLWR